MKGKKRITDIHEQVYAILEQYPQARDSDDTLWLIYCEKQQKGLSALPMYEVILRREEYNIPSYECLGRCRRKIQEKNPALRGSEYVTNMRYEEFKEWREYASS